MLRPIKFPYDSELFVGREQELARVVSMRRGIVNVVGETGSGKTWFLQHLKWLNRETAAYLNLADVNPDPNPGWSVYMITIALARALGADYGSEREAHIANVLDDVEDVVASDKGKKFVLLDGVFGRSDGELQVFEQNALHILAAAAGRNLVLVMAGRGRPPYWRDGLLNAPEEIRMVPFDLATTALQLQKIDDKYPR